MPNILAQESSRTTSAHISSREECSNFDILDAVRELALIINTLAKDSIHKQHKQIRDIRGYSDSVYNWTLGKSAVILTSGLISSFSPAISNLLRDPTALQGVRDQFPQMADFLSSNYFCGFIDSYPAWDKAISPQTGNGILDLEPNRLQDEKGLVQQRMSNEGTLQKQINDQEQALMSAMVRVLSAIYGIFSAAQKA